MDDSPYTPPKSVEDAPLGDMHATSKSHWFIRTMAIFTGAMMVGMAFTMMFIEPQIVFSLLWFGMMLFGILFVRAGILDRPPKLEFLSATKRAQRRKNLF